MGKKKNQNSDGKRQIISLMVIAIVSVVSVVTYKSLDNHYQSAYTNALTFSSGALSGGDNNPDYQVKNFHLAEQGGKFFIKWDNLQKADVSYVLQYAKTPAPITITEGVYSSSIGTFITLSEKSPSAQVHYYLGDLPLNLINLDQVMSGDVAVKDSGSTQGAIELDTAKKGEGYVYWIQTLVNNAPSAVSTKMIVTDWRKIGTKGVAFPFKDVKTTDWFYSYVSHLLTAGIIKSTDDFRPGASLNRAEAAKIALVMKNVSVTDVDPSTISSHFCDVAKDAWFARHIIKMKQKGWLGGYKSTKCKAGAIFDGTREVTRAEFIKIILSAYEINMTPYKKASAFSDVPADAWFNPYVNYALDKGMISLGTDKKFNPDAKISRAAMAKIVSKGLLAL